MGEKLALGLDLGGTNITGALATADGKLAAITRRKTHSSRGPGPVIDDMAGIVEDLITSHNISRDEVIGLGVGAPGPLSHRDGIIFKSANLPGWNNVRLRRVLLERTGLPTILDNDANVAAFGEFWMGAGKGVRQMVALTLGTGIGSGVILDGEVLRGYFENAAELGHLIVQAGGRPCSCGQQGCLEQYASASNLTRHCIELVKEGRESSLSELIGKGELGAKEVAEAAKAGDALAAEVWDEACYYLAVGCINVQHAFNPQMLVLSGGMSKAGDFLLARVRRYARELGWKLCDDQPEISISVLGDDAGVIGAAGMAWAARNSGVFG
ncbi:MAG TPA: ROK family protein [Phycisphaerae bacterium]|mgnify:CR=1 FL=1|nr:ROK family protein [Phycisphaerae bacterium]